MTDLLDRRLFIGAAAAIGLVPTQLIAAPANSFVMWHSPGCGCCLEWAKRMEVAFKRKLPIVETPDMARVKRAQGVPDDLQSCHTALIHGYAIEGHVPPTDIQRLIRSKSGIVRGLAVPGMPLGSPGMEAPDGRIDPYSVIAFRSDGDIRIFARYGGA